jgi:hypothetical protein
MEIYKPKHGILELHKNKNSVRPIISRKNSPGQWQNEFGTQPPTRRTIARIRDKFEADGTVHDVHK